VSAIHLLGKLTYTIYGWKISVLETIPEHYPTLSVKNCILRLRRESRLKNIQNILCRSSSLDSPANLYLIDAIGLVMRFGTAPRAYVISAHINFGLILL